MQGDSILDVHKITIVLDGESISMLKSVVENKDIYGNVTKEHLC